MMKLIGQNYHRFNKSSNDKKIGLINKLVFKCVISTLTVTYLNGLKKFSKQSQNISGGVKKNYTLIQIHYINKFQLQIFSGKSKVYVVFLTPPNICI